MITRPTAKTLWRLATALLLFALVDVLLTSIGVLFFDAAEGNPLLVALAELLPGLPADSSLLLVVWLSKITVIAVVLLAVHQTVKSVPERDDKLMFIGLLLSLLVYIGVIAGWIWFFVLAGTGRLGIQVKRDMLQLLL